jgi:hypothetical protein
MRVFESRSRWIGCGALGWMWLIAPAVPGVAEATPIKYAFSYTADPDANPGPSDGTVPSFSFSFVLPDYVTTTGTFALPAPITVGVGGSQGRNTIHPRWNERVRPLDVRHLGRSPPVELLRFGAELSRWTCVPFSRSVASHLRHGSWDRCVFDGERLYAGRETAVRVRRHRLVEGDRHGRCPGTCVGNVARRRPRLRGCAAVAQAERLAAHTDRTHEPPTEKR